MRHFSQLTKCPEIPFLGRRWPYAPGFAELTVDCDATVIPVIAPIDQRGSIKVLFHAPFNSLGEQASRLEKINHLIQQYAHFREQLWCKYPGNVPHRHWEVYSDLPHDLETDADGSMGQHQTKTVSKPAHPNKTRAVGPVKAN